jgi:hypothetical protein
VDPLSLDHVVHTFHTDDDGTAVQKRNRSESICQPLAMESKSGVQIACFWFHHSLLILGNLGVENGSMFRTNSAGAGQYKQASVDDLDNLLHSVLLRPHRNDFGM